MPSRTVSLPQAKVGRFIHDLLARGVQPHSFVNEPSHYVALSFDFELQDESYINDAIALLIHGQPQLFCSFCGVGDDERKVVGGPDAQICERCVELCVEVFREGSS